MKEEEFRKCYKAMIEWEPFPAEKARKVLKRLLEILFEPGQAKLEDKRGKDPGNEKVGNKSDP